MIVLRLGISSAFFRFYFDSKDPASALLVVRTSFWFTMVMATVGLAARACRSPAPIGHSLALGHDPWLVRAGAVGLWAQTNYPQLTALFRVEERSTPFAIASVANMLITVGAMVSSSSSCTGARSALVVGNFIGTLAVYLVLLAYRTRAARSPVRPHALPRDADASACRSSRRRSRSGRSTSSTGEFVGQYNGPRRGRRVLRSRSRSPRRDHVRDDRVPHRVARVRVLDRGRPRGEAHLRVRAHLPARRRCVGRHSRSARSHRGSSTLLDPKPALSPRREGRSRCSRSPAPSTPATACSRSAAAAHGRTQLNWSSPASARVANVGAQLLADPALRDGRRGDLDRRRLRRALRRHDDLRAASVYPVPYQWRRHRDGARSRPSA